MSRVTDMAARHAERDNNEIGGALFRILMTPDGRAVYRWIRANSRVFSEAPSDGTDRWLGWRDLGLYLLETMRAANLSGCQLAESEAVDIAASRLAEIDQAAHDDERDRLALDPIFPETSNHKD